MFTIHESPHPYAHGKFKGYVVNKTFPTRRCLNIPRLFHAKIRKQIKLDNI